MSTSSRHSKELLNEKVFTKKTFFCFPKTRLFKTKSLSLNVITSVEVPETIKTQVFDISNKRIDKTSATLFQRIRNNFMVKCL